MQMFNNLVNMLEVNNTLGHSTTEDYLSGKAMTVTNLTKVLLDSQKENTKLK